MKGKWLFPLDMDVIGPTSDSMSFQKIDIHTDVEIPTEQHVGAFGVQRKHHVHNGVDLYCEPHELDIPDLRKFLDDNGIPSYFLEFDVTVPIGQFQTRVEAFIETMVDLF